MNNKLVNGIKFSLFFGLTALAISACFNDHKEDSRDDVLKVRIPMDRPELKQTEFFIAAPAKGSPYVFSREGSNLVECPKKRVSFCAQFFNNEPSATEQKPMRGVKNELGLKSTVSEVKVAYAVVEVPRKDGNASVELDSGFSLIASAHAAEMMTADGVCTIVQQSTGPNVYYTINEKDPDCIYLLSLFKK